MSQNKIGIQVQVDFPSVTELQTMLNQRWQQVKKNYTAKINVDIDSNSLKTAVKKVRDAVSEKAFDVEIKVDSYQAIRDVKAFNDGLKELDRLLAVKRELKIDIKAVNLQTSLKEMMADVGRVNDELADQQRKQAEEAKKQAEKQKQAYEERVYLLEQEAKQFAKLQEITKNAGTNKESKTFKTTEQNGSETITTTYKQDGTKDIDWTDNRLKAVKEIEDVLKRIHQLEMKQLGTKGKEFELLTQELKVQRQQEQLLRDNYYKKYGEYSTGADSTKALINAQRLEIELKFQAELKKVLKEEEKQTADILSRVVQLEQKKHQLQLQMVNALDGEKKELQDLYNYYDNIQEKIRDKHNLTKKMTTEQGQEFNNLKDLHKLELDRVQAKKDAVAEQKKLSQAQQEANRDMLSGLKEIHSLEQKILAIESRRDADGKFGDAENQKLQALQQELSLAQQRHADATAYYQSQNQITAELREQLHLQERLNQQEQQRINATAEHVAKQDRINSHMKDLEETERQIMQLQRDLIYAGMREETVIKSGISALEDRANSIKEALRNEGAMIDKRDQELAKIRELQAEQRKLNQIRQEAREKDQAFNDTGGLIDPMSTYHNFEQGFRAVLQPVAELDEAYVKVAKVADATDETLQKFKETSFDVASGLGVSATDYMKAVETWVTAGKRFAESQELAKTSLIGSFVGNIEADDMVKFMSVPLTAFEKEGLKANDVINVMNETANNHAVEMVELGKAYMRSAGSVQTAGVSFQELTGLITGAQEATRMGGERIGTALKTIGINYNNIKGQITEGEAKKFDMLKSFGIDLEQTDGLIEALEILASKRDELSDVEMNEILYRMAGKEHQNILAGIIQQWETVGISIKTANEQMGQGETGSAYVEFGKQADSVRFKLAELKNAWGELMLRIGDSNGGVLGDVLDGLITGLQKLSDLAENEKLMEALKFGAIAIGIHALNNGMFRLFDTINTGSRSAWGNLVEVVGYFKNLRKATDDATEAQKNYNKAQATGSLAGGVGGVDVGGKGKGKDNDGKGGKGGNADDADKSIGKMSAKAGELTRMLGKSLALVPFLGDLLLVLELTGVPVFENLGKIVGKFTDKTQKQAEEYKKMINDFKQDNEFLNGEMEKNMSSYEEMKKKYDDIMNTDKDPNTKGTQAYLENDEFLALQEQFNGQAEALGLKIRIEANDTEHINAMLKELKSHLTEVDSKSRIEVVVKMGKDIDVAEKMYDQISALKAQKEQIEENIESVKSKMEALKDANGNIIDPQSYTLLSSALDNYKGDLEDVNGKLKSSSSHWKEATKSIQESAKAILLEGANTNATIYTKEQAVKITGALINEYSKMKGHSNTLASLQDKVAKGTKLSADELKKLGKYFPEYAGLSNTKIQADKNLQKEIGNVITKEKTKRDETIKGAEMAMSAVGKRAGKEKEVQKAIDSTNGKTKEASKTVQKYSGDIKDIPANKETTVSIFTKGMEKLKQLKDWLAGLGDKHISASASVSRPSDPMNQPLNTSGGGRFVSVSNGIAVRGVGADGNADLAQSTQKAQTSTTASTNSNARVSQDVWRYWATEGSIEKLDDTIRDLERSMKTYAENHDKLISLYKQEISALQSQQRYYTQLQSAKDHQMNQTLEGLRKYGFKTNTDTNSISNLSHAMNLKGTQAEEAQKLLDLYKSLNTELIGIGDKMADISIQIVDINEKIKEAGIAQEVKNYEAYWKKVDALQQKINNSDTIYEQRFKYISANDHEFGMQVTSQALNEAKTNLALLTEEYNKFSRSYISYAENAEKYKADLEQMGDNILKQADAVIKYTEAFNDLEISRVSDDLEKFNEALKQNMDNVDNNIKNLKEGLLSGTELADLQSSVMSNLDLNRRNEFEEMHKQRIKLEKELQETLDAFAKRNVDREKNVARATLEINKEMYEKLLKMGETYTVEKDKQATDKYMKGTPISILMNQMKSMMADFNTSINSGAFELDSVESAFEYDFNRDLERYFDNIEDKQRALTESYDKAMSKAYNPQDRENLTNQYILDSLAMQEDYYDTLITANKNAISELTKQLNDGNLTDSQEDKIRDLIRQYESEIKDAQNNIKDSISERFEFEFSLMRELTDQYDERMDSLQYTMDILNAMTKDNYEKQLPILEAMLQAEKQQNNQMKANIDALQRKLRLYEEGSYEWNIINAEIEEYQKLLQGSNKELLEMNKTIMSTSFSNTLSRMEKELFNGQTLDQFKNYQELWMTGLERELALEGMYQRLAELGTSVHDEKMAQLEKQEKLSKFEMDYLNKQLDVLELQQKVENLNRQRNIQTLQQNADGTWDWVYEADASEVSKAQQDLKKAQLELQEMEEQAREDYLNNLERILNEAEDGQYKNALELKDAMKELGEAFDTAIKDLSSGAYINSLAKDYLKYLYDNDNLLNSMSVSSYSVSAGSPFKLNEIGKNLQLAPTQLGGIPSAVKGNQLDIGGQPIQITLERIEFPNIKSAEGIKEAILNLPQIALQKSKERV